MDKISEIELGSSILSVIILAGFIATAFVFLRLTIMGINYMKINYLKKELRGNEEKINLNEKKGF